LNKNVVFRTAFGIVVVFLLCSLAFGPRTVAADLVWSEDFDSPDGWSEIGEPTFAENTGRGTPGERRVDIIYRQSSVSVGSWSFDVQFVEEWSRDHRYVPNEVSVRFLSSDPEAAPWISYSLQISPATTATGGYLLYKIVKNPEDGGGDVLADYDDPELSNMHGVHHFKITRDDAGRIAVLLNGTIIMEATNTDITTSEYFAVFFGADFSIDNIVVDDTPPGIPVELLAVGAGAVAIVVVTLVALKRRR
jgi:hypothetical protein